MSSSDALRAVLARLVDAMRCPKDRAARPEDWRGEWV